MNSKIFRASYVKVVIFDLDGTLTKSKLPLDSRMAQLLLRLLKERKVAIVGGGKINLFRRQILWKLPSRNKHFQNLFLFPTNGTAMYVYKKGWKKVYEHRFSKPEEKKILSAFKQALKITGYKPPHPTHGRMIEDRGSEITFSGEGQKEPLVMKMEWHRRHDIRKKLVRVLKKLLPKFEIRMGGLTSIDVTPKGIDKAYAIQQIQKKLHVSKKSMLFVGDAIYPGGNDYAVVKTGVRYIKVSGPEHTQKVIRQLFGNQKTRKN